MYYKELKSMEEAACTAGNPYDQEIELDPIQMTDQVLLHCFPAV